MLCPRTLGAAPRLCLVRQIRATKPPSPTCYNAWQPPPAGPQAWTSRQQTRLYAIKRRPHAYRGSSKDIYVTLTGDAAAAQAGPKQYGPRPGAGAPAERAGTKKKGEKRMPQDEAIAARYEFIHLKNEEDGTLSEPLRTEDVLEGMNLKTETLLCLYAPKAKDEADTEADDEATDRDDFADYEAGAASKAAPKSPSEAADEAVADNEGAEKESTKSKSPEFPVCTISSREKLREKREAEAKLQRLKELGTKELEFAWSIGQHDMERKLRKMQDLLGKGYTVEVALVPKKRSKQTVTQEQKNEAIRRVKEAVAEVPNAKECRKANIQGRDQLRLYFDAPGKKSFKARAAATASKHEAAKAAASPDQE